MCWGQGQVVLRTLYFDNNIYAIGIDTIEGHPSSLNNVSLYEDLCYVIIMNLSSILLQFRVNNEDLFSRKHIGSCTFLYNVPF